MTEEQRALVTRVAETVKDTQPVWSAALNALLAENRGLKTHVQDLQDEARDRDEGVNS